MVLRASQRLIEKRLRSTSIGGTTTTTQYHPISPDKSFPATINIEEPCKIVIQRGNAQITLTCQCW